MSNKRNIFQEVGASDAPQTRSTGMIDAGGARGQRAVAIWLLILFKLVVLMIIVGGLTRLTDSGLSITEWQPIRGALPPLSAEAWDAVFTKYKEIPEYTLQNKGMSLAEFKVIYWWEWGHRQLGRLVGLVWGVGFFIFLATQRIPTGWTQRLLLIGGLGGLQGAIGWWMVSSGLTGRMVDVASYRLATHLGLAFVILGLLIWFYWQIKAGDAALYRARRSKDARLVRWTSWLAGLVFFQILLGALVAGIDAGRGYIDWPMMGGEFLPSESFDETPLWRNLFENPALVQWNHRMVGYAVMVFGVFVWLTGRTAAVRAQVRTLHIVFGLMLAQMTLGILTVLNAAPLLLAMVHQIGAIALFVFVLRARFVFLYPPAQNLRSD